LKYKCICGTATDQLCSANLTFVKAIAHDALCTALHTEYVTGVSLSNKSAHQNNF